MAMLYGESDHQIDEKGRIFIPRRFHAEFEHGGFLTRAFNGFSLVCFPHAEWEGFQQRLTAIKSRLAEQDAAQYLKAELASDDLTRFLSCGVPITLDGQGRLAIPPNLRRRAGLEKDVTLIGMGDRFEIWDTQNWLAYDEAHLKPTAMGQALSELSMRQHVAG
ncbi:MAG: division/cell wall cluster transcriptional repressor MraZ [Armatimonadota bacterium]